MGWKPIETLTCLLREDKRLRLVCPCGHVAEPDVRALRSAVWIRKRDFEARLADLKKHLRCGACGGKDFGYEIVPPLP